MPAAIYAPDSVFVRALSPVIVRAKAGRLAQVSAVIEQRALTRALGFGPLAAWRVGALSAARQIPSFSMHAAVLDAITITQLAQDPNVEAIYEDRLARISQYPYAPPTGTYYVSVPSQAGGGPTRLSFTSTDVVRSLLGVDTAAAAGYDGSGVLACVLDTGGHIHPQTRRAAFLTAIPGNHVDVISHGQWCLSALGGTRYQDEVFSAAVGSPVVCQGMAPGCGLLAIKALDFVIGTAPTSVLLSALEMALARRPDVVSLSWGSPAQGTSPEADPFYPAMQALDAAGALVFAAAGNSGPGAATLDSPGALPQPITVGAYNVVSNNFNASFGNAGEVAGFSSRGPTPWGDTKPDCVAPGAIIDSGVSPVSEMAVSYTQRPHPAQAIAGSSMSTPIAAGLGVLMRQAHQKLLGRPLLATEFKQMLAYGAGAKSNTSGWGPLTWGLYARWLSIQYGLTVPGA